MNWGFRLAGTYVDQPRAGVSLSRLGMVARYGLYVTMLVASLMFYVWSRVDVRASAASLDSSLVQLSSLQADHERLTLEHASRRDLGRLGRVGVAMGMAGDVAIVNLGVE